MTRVLVTRPEPGATRTLMALIERRVDAVSLPLTKIQPLNFVTPKPDFETLIITSQNAIGCAGTLLRGLAHVPVFAVGSRTAKTLQRLGHTTVKWAETAQDLLPLIIAHKPRSALYVCGQTRRPELEIGLSKARIPCRALEVYRAAPTENVSKALKAFFNDNPNPIILLHAPSAAEAFVLAMKDQNLPGSTRFLCMSAAISAPLPENWRALTTLAKQPDEEAMINQLDKMLA